MNIDEQKHAAALKAMDYVKDGMKLGLGTGSTAAAFVDIVGAAVKDGLNLLCVPTSVATHAQAKALGIPLTTLEETPHLDLTVDGADELDDNLCLIKGGGGALLREMIVATASDQMVVIADASKHVEKLGKFPLPVEIDMFGMKSTYDKVIAQAKSVGCTGDVTLREKQDGTPFITDGGNYILDCSFYPIEDPVALAKSFHVIPGVVESGLFINIAKTAIIAGENDVKVLSI